MNLFECYIQGEIVFQKLILLGGKKEHELVHSSRKPIAIQYIRIKFSGRVKSSHKLSTLSTDVFEAPSQTQLRGKCCKQGFPYRLWPSTKVKEKGLRRGETLAMRSTLPFKTRKSVKNVCFNFCFFFSYTQLLSHTLINNFIH